MAQPRITSFLVKIASRCNLDCDYCYVYHHADQSWRTMPAVMSASDRSAFATQLGRYVREEQISRCVVIFHGGEPLLAGADTIASFAQQLRHETGPEVSIDFGLQTNGLLLSDAALATLENANIAVSLSLDGPKEVNDLHRTTRRGRSSFDRVSAALERLRTRPKVFAGIIAVIDPRISPESLFAFFAEHKPPKLDFLLPDAHHLRPPPGRDVNPDLYKDWLIRAFDLWLDQYPDLPVRTFEALLDAATGLPSATDAFGLGDVSLVTVETDGSYHDLDVLKVVGDGASQLSGTVRDTLIAAVANSSALAAHSRLLTKEGLCADCRSCVVVDVCGGGSLPHRFGATGFQNPTVYCAEMLALITHVRDRLKSELAVDQARSTQNLPSTFDFPSFEAAEAAHSAVGDLWRSACAANEVDFARALDAVAMGQSVDRATVDELRGADDARKRHLASRPGTVAWQRTFLGEASGVRVHAVDGTPLSADVEYLRFLANLSARDSLEVATDDAWLRKPFGTSIIFENEAVASAARPLVDTAFAIVRDWRPALFEEMCHINRAVQFVRDPAAHEEKIVSFSDNAVPGALFVSITQNGELIDPYDLADSLVHEHRHQKLYLLERIAPMIEQTDMTVVSPWREDPRPPSGLLHAVFVFVELRRLWMHIRRHGPARLANRAINQINDTDARLEEGLRTLERCPLTPHGRKLFTVLAQACASELPVS
jgi:uncharacterized protein